MISKKGLFEYWVSAFPTSEYFFKILSLKLIPLSTQILRVLFDGFSSSTEQVFFRFDRNVQNSREELFFCDAMLKLLCSNNETNAMYSRWPRILLATNFFVIFCSRRRRVTRKGTLVNFRSLSRKWRNLLDRWFSFGITSNSSEDDNKSTIDPHAKLSFSYSILSLRYFCLGGPFLGGSRTLREIRRN